MMTFDFSIVLAQWSQLLNGWLLTFLLTAVAIPIGFVLGVACAWLRVYGASWVKWLVGAYVEIIRNTPFIIQLFFIFFGLPAIGVKLSPDVASGLAMALNLTAYACEVVRAGILGTNKGLIEAAESLALNRWQVFVDVVLPPALKRIWPAIVSQTIIVMLGSAVCGQVSAQDVSYAASLISSRTFRSFESYVVVGVIYLLSAILMRQFLLWFGARFLFGDKKG